MLDEAEKIDRLRLIRSQNVGPITFHQLIARYGNAGEALKQIPELVRKGGGRKITLFSKQEAEKEYHALYKLGGHMLFHGEDDYPKALHILEDAPPLLSVMGHHHILNQDAVAIVGARNASANGCKLARKFAYDLAKTQADYDHGFMVISGLARGIDAHAHEGALKAAMEGGASTIAVVAGGVDYIYPKENTKLYHQIKELGVVVSENPLTLIPQARDFPRRNRLVSGLSRGVLVVEAAPKSGSLITAKLSLDQGREVFAIPGSPLDARARGTNDLIKSGAYLCERADDIFQALFSVKRLFDNQYDKPNNADLFSPNVAESEAEYETLRPKLEQEILTSLSSTPLAIDELMRLFDYKPAFINSILLELELAGRIERHPGHAISLTMEENG